MATCPVSLCLSTLPEAPGLPTLDVVVTQVPSGHFRATATSGRRPVQVGLYFTQAEALLGALAWVKRTTARRARPQG